MYIYYEDAPITLLYLNEKLCVLVQICSESKEKQWPAFFIPLFLFAFTAYFAVSANNVIGEGDNTTLHVCGIMV